MTDDKKYDWKQQTISVEVEVKGGSEVLKDLMEMRDKYEKRTIDNMMKVTWGTDVD